MQISLQLRAIFRPVYGSLVPSSIGIGETFTWTEYCGWDRWSLQSPHLFLDTKLACAVWPHGSSFPFPAWDSDQASLGRRELLLLPRAGWAGTSAWAVAGLSSRSSPGHPHLPWRWSLPRSEVCTFLPVRARGTRPLCQACLQDPLSLQGDVLLEGNAVVGCLSWVSPGLINSPSN